MTAKSETLTTQTKASQSTLVNWRKAGSYIALTFGLTLALDLVLWLVGGLGNPGALGLLQLQMLLPALSAIILRRYVFRDSTVHISHYRETPRWVFNAFLMYVIAQIIVVAVGLVQPEATPAFAGISTAAGLLCTIALFVIRAISGREAFDRAGLRIGRLRDFVLWGVLFMAYYASQTALNGAFGLGSPVDLTEAAAQAGLPANVLVIVAFVQSVVFAPVLFALFMAFGEEYGWRGMLQDQLTALGRIKGVALVGLIWGAWHLPAIWMGHNYPGRPLLGSVLMMIYSIELGFILGYAMLKTKSIWLVAFLHAVNNHAYQVLSGMVIAPTDPAFGFGGTGIYSLIVMAGIVALVLRDPIWHDAPTPQ